MGALCSERADVGSGDSTVRLVRQRTLKASRGQLSSAGGPRTAAMTPVAGHPRGGAAVR